MMQNISSKYGMIHFKLYLCTFFCLDTKETKINGVESTTFGNSYGSIAIALT